MFNRRNNLPMAAAIAAAIAGAGTAGAGAAVSASQDVLETRQESQIRTAYELSPHLRANDLMVTVHDGRATLSGNVAEGVNKDLARQIALGVDGIESVDNQIAIIPNYVPRTSSVERSYGEVVDDATITAAVKSKLLWSRHADDLEVAVDAIRSEVPLAGTAGSSDVRAAAGALAPNTPGVQGLDNRLKVQPDQSGSARIESAEIADGWISTRIRSTFRYSLNERGADIGISTSSGVVKLSGRMANGAERALVIELAGDVRGVKSVDSSSLTL